LAFMTIGPRPNSYCIDRSANIANRLHVRRTGNALCAKSSKAAEAYHRPTTSYSLLA
jgi:hypothetical protein